MDLEITLITRLLVAGIFGIAIGVEREYRAKEAGVRTHFMVCLGSALFTIVSQFGFVGATGLDLEQVNDLVIAGRLEPSRVAAQIVSGIGFIGAGTIMFRRHMLVGLTTAAGIWTTAAIGMAAGGGLYVLALFSTALAIAGFEMLRWVSQRIGHMRREISVAFTTADANGARIVCDFLKSKGHVLTSYSSARVIDGRVRVKLSLDSPECVADPEVLYDLFGTLPDVEIEEVG